MKKALIAIINVKLLLFLTCFFGLIPLTAYAFFFFFFPWIHPYTYIREPAGPAHSAGKSEAVASAHPGRLKERGVAGELQAGLVGQLEPIGWGQRGAGPARRRTRVRVGGVVRRERGAWSRRHERGRKGERANKLRREREKWMNSQETRNNL